MLTTIAMWSLVPAREGGGQFSIGFIYWLLILLWIIFGFFAYWPRGGAVIGYGPVGNHLLALILFILIGIALFGFPIGG
jgi:hypothetical protein